MGFLARGRSGNQGGYQAQSMSPGFVLLLLLAAFVFGNFTGTLNNKYGFPILTSFNTSSSGPPASTCQYGSNFSIDQYPSEPAEAPAPAEAEAQPAARVALSIKKAQMQPVMGKLGTQVVPDEPQRRWPPSKYLYWGPFVDYPGVHSGYIHQTISLTCALEESKFLNRTFVAPSYIRFPGHHNDPGLAQTWFGHNWRDSWGTPIEEFFDLEDVGAGQRRIITDSSPEWAYALSQTLVTVNFSVPMESLKEEPYGSQAIIVRNIGHGKYWFDQCLSRLGGLANYDYIWWNATDWEGGLKYAPALQGTAQKVSERLGSFAALHLRRGDKVLFGDTGRTLWPHLDRDTRPEAILRKLEPHLPEGSAIYLATNDKTPGFLDPLKAKYRLYTPGDFIDLLEPVLHNNFQMFIIESMLFRQAALYVGTFSYEIPSLGNGIHLTEDKRQGCPGLEDRVLTEPQEDEPQCPQSEPVIKTEGGAQNVT